MEEAGELAFTSTYDCAAHNFCIPCFHKLFPSGKIQIAEEELQLPHNVRPELCPRSSGDSEYTSRIYSSKAKILTVGDGDLTFSRSLAQSFAHQLTATTHESHQSLLKTYPNAPEVLDALRSAGVTMFHEVDATNFESHAEVRTHKFDIVIWNFPCVRIERGADGQVSELEQNQELLRLFFRSVKSILRPKGEVHVTHKTIEPFSWWGLTTLAAAEGLQLFQTIVFDRCNYAGYTNRKVLDKKSFPCNDARTYIFTLQDVAEHKSLLSKKAHITSLSDPANLQVLLHAAQQLTKKSSSVSPKASKRAISHHDTTSALDSGHLKKKKYF